MLVLGEREAKSLIILSKLALAPAIPSSSRASAAPAAPAAPATLAVPPAAQVSRASPIAKTSGPSAADRGYRCTLTAPPPSDLKTKQFWLFHH